MANQGGVFANIRTFLEEGKKSFSTFMKYTLCKHRSQLETTGVSSWEMYIFLMINSYTSLSI